jgi:DNA-binding NarL/FixJ family response regulator
LAKGTAFGRIPVAGQSENSVATDHTQPLRISQIFVVDDHPLVREGLAIRLAKESDMEICGEAEGVEDAIAQIRTKQPDLVIVDLGLGHEHGLELLKLVRSHAGGRIKTLILTAYDESVFAERALRAGALGYVNKRASWDVIVEAIRTVLKGRRYLSPDLTGALLDRALGSAETGQPTVVDVLTDRELEVFRLIGQGLATGAIAHQLFLSTHTIDSHRENIKIKLKLKSGNELTRMAIQWVMENG